MGSNKKQQKHKMEKELKNYGKYGQMQIKHSHMGIWSCAYALGAAIVIFVAILLAYLKHGESAGYVGGIGILAVGLSIFGIQAGSKGLKERERKYITCRVGIVCNILILIFLIVIFVGGIR